MRSAARFVTAVRALLVFVLLGASQSAYASFSLTFQGLVQTLSTGGSITLSGPSAAALDTAGDAYIVDSGNNRIVEVTAAGVASVVAITGLSPALASPTGIAIDDAGNLYIADTGNNRVVKVTPGGAGSVISSGSVTLSSPRGVAIDNSGNLFIADTGNNRIVRVSAGGSAAALPITGLVSPSTLNTPLGLATDGAGNLYISDSGDNRIVTVAAGGTAGTVLSIAGGVTLNAPSDVTLDGIGNVYIADSGNNRIAEVDSAGNGTVLYTGSATLSGALGVAVGVFGTVYVSDTGNNRALVVDPPVSADITSVDPTYSLNRSVVDFGHIELGSSSGFSLTLPFSLGSTPLGSVKVFTGGVEGLDFTAGVPTTCDGTTGANASCTVEVKFLPTAAGLRTGAVVLYDNAQSPMLTVPLSGFSDAPVAAVAPYSATLIATGGLMTQFPFQLALDGAGNLYAGNYVQTGGQPKVVKIAAGGGSATVVSTAPITLGMSVTGIALDSSGNVFIADYYNERIVVVTPGGVASVLTINGLSSALGEPTELAFDAAGNLYIAEFLPNPRIVRVSSLVVSGSSSSGLGRPIATGSYTFAAGQVTGVAVAPNGTVYIAARTANSSHVVQVTAAGVASLLAPSGLTLSSPQGAFVDGMGNLYVEDSGNSRIVRITTAGIASVIKESGLTAPATLSSGFGVTGDALGNLYIPDWTNNRIVYMTSSPTLDFASTQKGLTSTDSPRTATVTNLGNRSLVFSANPTYTADFSNSSGDTSPCTSSSSLTPGSVCDVAVNFTPQSAGSLSAVITLNDNHLNAGSSLQQVAVSGTGVANASDTTSTAATITPSSLVNGQTATITATVADTAAGHISAVPTGAVTFTDTVGTTVITFNGNSAVALAGGTASLTGVQLSGIGMHTITANYQGVTGSFLASSHSTVATLAKAPVTLTVPSTPAAVPAGQAASFNVTVTGPYASIPAASGSLGFAILSASGAGVASGTALLTSGTALLPGSSSTASLPVPGTLARGSYTMQITYAGDANYLAAPAPATLLFMVGQIATTVSLTSGTNPLALLNAVTFTATVVGTSGTPTTGMVSFMDGTAVVGTSTLVSGVATFTTTTLGAGTHTIIAVYSAQGGFAAGTSNEIAETVQDFTLSPPSSGSNSQTVSAGGSARYSLAFGPTNGTTFPGPVNLSVSGLPPGATATLTPPALGAGSAQTNVILSVQLAAAAARLTPPGSLQRRMPMLAWGVLLLPFVARLRRANRCLLWVFLMVVAGAAGLSGCGSSGGSAPSGQQPQSYTVTVTGTSGMLSHSTTVSLTVE